MYTLYKADGTRVIEEDRYNPVHLIASPNRTYIYFNPNVNAYQWGNNYDFTSETIVIDDEVPNLLSANSFGHEIYWLKYYNFLKRTFVSKHSKQDEKNLKQVSWTDVIKEIKTSHLSK
jgi:hypothetical protein